MPSEPPPPLPAAAASGPPPAPQAAPVPAHRAGDDGASGARALAWWSIGCTAAALLCCGGTTLVLVEWISKTEREFRERVVAADADARLRADAEALLDALADELAAGAAELPITLPEAPPKDPWGRPVRYRRSGPLRAFLASAGPDGVFGTSDDVTRQVRVP